MRANDRSDEQRRLDRLRTQVADDLVAMSVESEIAPSLGRSIESLVDAQSAIHDHRWPEAVGALGAAAHAIQRAGGTQTVGVPGWSGGARSQSHLECEATVVDLVKRALASVRRHQLDNAVCCISDAAYMLVSEIDETE